MTPPSISPELAELLRHEPWLRRLAHQLVRDPHTAEDLVQETWVAALRGRDVQTPKAWLRQVFVHRLRSHWRSEIRREDSEPRAGRFEAQESHEAEIAEEDMRRTLGEAVLSLREPYRTAMLEHYLHESSSVEIAEREGVPESTVRWRLMRGREQLREQLDRRVDGGRSSWVSGLVVLGGVPVDVKPVAAASGSFGAWIAAAALLPLALFLGWGLSGGWDSDTESAAASSTKLARVQPTRMDAGAEDATLPEESAGPSPTDAGRRELEPTSSPEEAPETTASSEGIETDRTYPLTVRVFEKDSGTPLADARLFVATPGGLVERGRTDAEGMGHVDFAEEDFHGAGFERLADLASVRIAVPGRPWSTLHSFSRELLLANAGTEKGLSFPVEGASAVVFGRVVDEEGLPLADAKVRLGASDGLPQFSPRPGFFTTFAPLVGSTDVDGRFRFEGAWPRPLELRVQASGRPDMVRLVDASEANEIEVELTLARGAALAGEVRGDEGRPVAGARIWFDPPEYASLLANQATPGYLPELLGFASSVTADEAGRFRLEGLPAGTHRFWAQDPERPEYVAQALLEVDAGAGHRWDPQLEERPAIELRVQREQEDDEPLFLHVASSKVRDPSFQRLIEVPADGRVLLHDWPDILLDTYVQGRWLAEAPLAQRRHFRAGHSPIELSVRPPTTVKVTVDLSDHRGERGVVASLVMVDRELDLSALIRISSRDGTATLDLPSGLYHPYLEVESRGLVPLEPVELVGPESVELELRTPEATRLVPSGAEEVEGQDLRYVLRAHIDFGKSWDPRYVVAEGPGLPKDPIELLPGVYSLVIESGGQIIAGSFFPVETGVSVPVDVRPGSPPFVPVRVMAGTDPAPAGTRLEVSAIGGEAPALVLQDTERTVAGTWHVPLHPGSYELVAHLPAGDVLHRPLEVPPGGVRQVVVLTHP